MWKGLADGKKTKRLSKEETKKQFLDSIIIEEVAEICKIKHESFYMHSFSFEYVFILVCTDF